MIGHIYTCAFVGSSYKYIMLFNALTWKTQNWILSLLELMFVWQIFCLEHVPLASHFTFTMHGRICVFLLSVVLLPFFNL